MLREKFRLGKNYLGIPHISSIGIPHISSTSIPNSESRFSNSA